MSNQSLYKDRGSDLTMSNQTIPDIGSFHKVPVTEAAFCAWVRVLINLGLGGAISLLGIIGNMIAYTVLNGGRSSAPVATYLLRSLALTDNLFLVVWFINIPVRDLLRYINYNSLTWRYVRLYSYPILYIGQCATIWMTVIIAFARYIAVCKPYIARRICSLANLKLTVLALYLLVLCYNIPHFFEAEIKPVNGTMWLVDSELGKSYSFKVVYSQIMYNIFTFGLPLALLSVLNILLLVAYRRVTERRQRMQGLRSSRGQQEDTNITLVMIIVIAVFIMCQLPARIVQIVWDYQFESCHSSSFYLMELATLLEVLNSSVNFIIYSLIRPQFRRSLLHSLCSYEHAADGLLDMNLRQVVNSNAISQQENGDIERKTDVSSCSFKYKDSGPAEALLNNGKPQEEDGTMREAV